VRQRNDGDAANAANAEHGVVQAAYFSTQAEGIVQIVHEDGSYNAEAEIPCCLQGKHLNYLAVSEPAKALNNPAQYALDLDAAFLQIEGRHT
jgi:hypothetical protein